MQCTDSFNSTSSLVYHDNILLLSGILTDRLWWLNLSSFVWYEELCSGEFPPPTRFHATAQCGSRIYVCGGEYPLLEVPQSSMGTLRHDLMDLFALNLIDLRWERLSCAWKPQARSHHTMTAVNDNMLIVFGGKPLRDEVTSYEMRDMMANGFFAVYIFDIASSVWRVFSQPLLPKLWGHTAQMLNNDALVIFGGFETTLEMDEKGEEVPTIAVNNHLWFLNSKTMECYRRGDVVNARVMHKSHICGNNLCVLGGFSVDESTLELVLQRDAMEISLLSFETRPMSFCLKHWPLEHIASVVYNRQLIVMNKTEDIFVLQTDDDENWIRYRCDIRRIRTPPFLITSVLQNQRERREKSGRMNSQEGSMVGQQHWVKEPPPKPSVSPVLWTTFRKLEYPVTGLS
ncbi:uncharacterized protein TM35_000291140 [Trypanosoma theileri]|uniref:Uncharacterized protein n=1 Tax=Trypanosoma theileri TaxID=67003 RepID=A0A1X0NNC8_9TRYP|nr:uncharacterized protein TM35_000291140 [Trypanosoma theileri]ORC86232.1 hypothetical protein TM35_000291140 [Trypanosoma theileri]